LKFGSEAWVLKKREEQRLEAAQMKFLRHLLRITKLDKEKNQCIRGKTGAQNIVEELKLLFCFLLHNFSVCRYCHIYQCACFLFFVFNYYIWRVWNVLNIWVAC